VLAGKRNWRATCRAEAISQASPTVSSNLWENLAAQFDRSGVGEYIVRAGSKH
jgi:hypothetical protein